MAKKGETWSEKECLALITAWGNEVIQSKLAGTHKNTDVYKKISKMLFDSGYSRDWTQCRTKIKHLKSEYKKYKDELSRSGAERTNPPRFFEQLDSFLGDRPEAKGLTNSIDTSNTETQETDVNFIPDDVSDDSTATGDILTQKYGRGKVVEKECPQCGHNVYLKTGGVHIGESGSIAVYSDVDQLVCPNCSFTEQVLHSEDGEGEEEEECTRKKQKITDSTVKKNEKKETKRGKPSKLQLAFEKSMGEQKEYQQQSDKMFLNQMKEECAAQMSIRREELNAYKESMALLANAIGGQQQQAPTAYQQHQQPIGNSSQQLYPVQHDFTSQKTYYTL